MLSLPSYQTHIQRLMEHLKKTEDFETIPLLRKENCEDAADHIVEILIAPISSNTCTNVRKSTIALTQRLCRRNVANHFKWDKYSLSVLLKTFLLETNIEMHCKKLTVQENALKQICNDFPEFNIFHNKSASYELDIDFMYALSNLDTVESSQVLRKVIQNIDSDNLSDEMYEFMLNMWTKKDLNIIDDALYVSLTMKIISHLEILFLDISRILLLENEDLEEINLRHILDMQKFEPLKFFLKKCAMYDICFNLCVNLLNEILIISKFNDAIQKFITYVIKTIKSLSSTSLTGKYPNHLQTIVFYLQFYPNHLDKSAHTKPILESVNLSLDNLKNQNWNSYVMLISHNLPWLQYFMSKSI